MNIYSSLHTCNTKEDDLKNVSTKMFFSPCTMKVNGLQNKVSWTPMTFIEWKERHFSKYLLVRAAQFITIKLHAI